MSPDPTNPASRSSADVRSVLRAWFGEDALRSPRSDRPRLPRDQLGAIELAPGTITLLTGGSGGGKSTLLRTLVRRLQRSGDRLVLDLQALPLPRRPALACFHAGVAMRDRLDAVGRFGLAEAALLARPPTRLSEGERHRLRLALAWSRAIATRRPAVIVSDEFAAMLDRVTATSVAAALRRALDRGDAGPALLLATSHDDLVAPLRPETWIDCDYGEYKTRRGQPQMARKTQMGSEPPRREEAKRRRGVTTARGNRLRERTVKT